MTIWLLGVVFTPALFAQVHLARTIVSETRIAPTFCEPFCDGDFAGGCRDRLRPQDQVWVVSSRHLDVPCREAFPPQLKTWRWNSAQNGWSKLPAEEFFAEDEGYITLIYVHGNRVDSAMAIELGWYAYDALVANHKDPRSIRFVIWSWPSKQIKGQINDLRYKACRTDADGCYLGWFMSQIHPDVPVSLMGFSYGSRIITGGLHVAAGGHLAGVSLPPDCPRRQENVRSVLMAAALHSDWLTAGSVHGEALAASDRVLLLTNNCDPALKRYPWLFHGEHASALGYTGLASSDCTGKVRRFEASDYVGKTHDSLKYLDCPALVHLARGYTLWEPVK